MSRRLTLSVLLALLALAALPSRASAGWFPAAPVDGPTPDIDKLGGVDLARDGTGGVVYLKQVDGVPARLRVALQRRHSSGRPSASTTASAPARARRAIAAADADRLVVVWTAGTASTAASWPGNDQQPGPLLGPTELYNDPSGLSTDIAVDMGINGAAYATWAGAGRRRLGRPRRAPAGRGAGRRSARRWTSTPRSAAGRGVQRPRRRRLGRGQRDRGLGRGPRRRPRARLRAARDRAEPLLVPAGGSR